MDKFESSIPEIACDEARIVINENKLQRTNIMILVPSIRYHCHESHDEEKLKSSVAIERENSRDSIRKKKFFAIVRSTEKTGHELRSNI